MKVLFLCTGNSCRSQMAEGWARRLLDEEDQALSAGTHPTALDPRAVAVMAEAGLDISGREAKSVTRFRDEPIDLLVTVCDGAQESCPHLPGAVRTLHRAFPDPPRLAATIDDEEGKLMIYRTVRDEIRRFVEELASNIRKGTPWPWNPF